MNTDKKIFLNTTYQILGKIITSGIGLLSVVLLTRYLDTSNFGEYNLIFAYTNFAIIFADFGLGTLLTREVAAKRHTSDFVSQIFSLRLYLSIITIFFSTILLLFLPYSPIVKIGIIISFIGIVFLQLAAIFWAHFQAEFDFKKTVISQIAVSLVTILITLVGIFGRFSLLFFVVAQITGSIAGFLFSYYLFSQEKVRLTFQKKLVSEIILQAWPLGLGAIVSVAYFKIDSLLLSYYFNPATTNDFSIYSVAYKPFEVTIVFGGFFIQTLFPLFSANLLTSQFKKIFSHYFLYTIVLSCSITGLLYFFSGFIIFVLGGEKYKLASASLKILSFAAGLSILSGFFSAVALAAKKQLYLLYIASIAFVVNISLNIFVLPKYSYIGASWTTVITQAVITVLSVLISFSLVQKKHS